jgi:L-asparaginase/Glu-tRNA(Gln) amidotransferase subunit D
VNRPRLGEIRTEISLEEDHPRRGAYPIRTQPGFEGQVAVLSLAPGKPTSMFLGLLDAGIRGLILRGYGPGNIPYQYLEVLERARALGVPVIVHSQCIEGMTAMRRYDVGRRALEMGAIEARDMSLEAAVTKLMWLLRRETDCDRIRERMQTDLAGEIGPG